MKLQEQILKELKNKNLKYKSFSQLFSHLSAKLNVELENIAKCVNKMVSEGILVEGAKKSLVLTETYGFRKGIVCGNSKGYGFIKPLMGSLTVKGDAADYFVPASKLFGALDGDEVLFKIENESASVIKILKRNNNLLVGELVSGGKLSFKNKRIELENFYVVADNEKFSKPILVSKRDLKEAKDGDRVVVELTFQPEGEKSGLPVGRIKEILAGNDIETGMVAILCEHQIPDKFPDKVIKEVEVFVTDFEKEKNKRIDLTDKLIVTIDGSDARDLDDAISIEKTSEGYILGVHIADVGEYVRYNSNVDKEAFFRGTSVYFPDRVYPMLPEKLSNDLCSLNPNEEKLALTVEMNLDRLGEVQSYRIFESVIKSSARLTYDQVYEVIRKFEKSEKDFEINSKDIRTNTILTPQDVENLLEAQREQRAGRDKFADIKDKKIVDTLLLMNELSLKVGRIRERSGALDFDLPETYFEMDGKKILDVRPRERNEAHKLIENFMILCNQTVAKTFFELEIPFVYRIHGKPSKIRFNEVVELLNGFGLDTKITKNITPNYIQKILAKLKDKEYCDIGNKLILRALEKALYSEECLGHFGLALEYYCHFTSPIRRYPDLTIHRIIKKACKASVNNIINSKQINKSKIQNIFKNDYDLEDFVVDSALRSSERERKSDEAERDADDLFKAKFMKNKIGEIFKGRISGVTNFGLFVELANTVEGLIKIENLPVDDYQFDEKKLILKGKKKKFQMGDKVEVELADVNVVARKIEFKLLNIIKSIKK